MAFMTGRPTACEFLEALGEQNKGVRRLAIVADVDSVTTVFVERFADEQEVDAAARALGRLKTVELARVGRLEIDDRGRAYVPAAEHAEALRWIRLAVATLEVLGQAPVLIGELRKFLGEG